MYKTKKLNGKIEKKYIKKIQIEFNGVWILGTKNIEGHKGRKKKDTNVIIKFN
jgi:hypothetical protein